MKKNDRIRAYARAAGIETTGAFKSNASKDKLVSKLTPKQRRRIKKKAMA